jgi:hypothetical protein
LVTVCSYAKCATISPDALRRILSYAAGLALAAVRYHTKVKNASVAC